MGKLDAVTANGPEGDVLDWDAVDWRQVEDDVRRLRQRIFTASRAGDLKKVRSLQKLMLRSRASALLSVRRVTEVNAGRKTAGVDGRVVLAGWERADMVTWLQRGAAAWRPMPVRRVFIPKANGKRRGLGIPTQVDEIEDLGLPGFDNLTGEPVRLRSVQLVGAPVALRVLSVSGYSIDRVGYGDIMSQAGDLPVECPDQFVPLPVSSLTVGAHAEADWFVVILFSITRPGTTADRWQLSVDLRQLEMLVGKPTGDGPIGRRDWLLARGHIGVLASRLHDTVDAQGHRDADVFHNLLLAVGNFKRQAPIHLPVDLVAPAANRRVDGFLLPAELGRLERDDATSWHRLR